MNILVTGSTGFIGRHACPQLAAHHRVFAVTRRADAVMADGVIPVVVDLADVAFASKLPDNIDAVLALAQSRGYRRFPDQAEDIVEINIRSLVRLLEWSRTSEVKRFVIASSANVYRRSADPITEDSTLEPDSFYARTKRMAEMAVESYRDFFSCTALRLFTVYGPGQVDALIPSLIDRVANGRSVDLQGEHGLGLSPIFVGDVARLMKASLEDNRSETGFETLNVGGSEVTDIRRLAVTLGTLMDRRPVFEPGDVAEPGAWVADCTRLRARHDLSGLTPLEEGLDRTIEAVRASAHATIS